jgi:hypothetical protein
MLSFIYRIYREFELEMGYRPNVLFINPEHLKCLVDEMGEEPGLPSVRERLGMEILMREDAVHPGVAWLVSGCRKAG